MKHNQIKRCVTIIMLAVFIASSGTPAVTPAVASGLMDITKITPYSKRADDTEAVKNASTIYYGKNNKGEKQELNAPIQWRVLAVNPDEAGEIGNKGVLLLSQKTLWMSAFDTRTEPLNQVWAISQIRAYMSGLPGLPGRPLYEHPEDNISSADNKEFSALTEGSFARGAFLEAEYNAILDTTHRAGGGTGDKPNIVSTDRIFLLSKDEAESGYFVSDHDRAPASGGPSSNWWLRSPASANDAAYYVSTNTGAINPSETKKGNAIAVRPALNLNPESVLFLSAAVEGKNSAACSGRFGIDNEYTGANGWKVTLMDAFDEDTNTTGIKAPTDVVVTQEQVGSLDYMAERSSILDLTAGSYTTTWGNNLLVSYNADAIIDNKANMVSALAVTGEGTEGSPYIYKDYASISYNASETQRKVNIDKLQTGDKIFVYAEQANGDKKTDYASDLVDTGVTIQEIGTDAGTKNEGTLSAAYKDKDLTANIGQKFKLGLEQASYNTKVNVGEGGGEVFGGATIAKLEVEDDVTVTGFVTAKETEIKTEGKKITTNGVFVSDKFAAIGYGSVASEKNTISVGASGSERKIVNVAAGKNGTDAANVEQMNTALATKQDKLKEEQLAAVNSGITSNKVVQYDSYATTIKTNKELADAAIKKNAEAIAANKAAISDVASDIITGFTSTGGAVKAVKADNSTLDVAQLHNGVVNGGTITTDENNKKYLTLTVKDEYTGATKTLPGISLEGISSAITIEGQTAPLTNGANIAFTPVYDTDGKTVKAISIGLQNEISLGSANFNTGNGYVWIDEDGISMTERGDEEGSNYGKFSEMTTDHITLGYQTTATDEKIYAALRPDSLTIDGHDYITKAGLNAGDKEIANVAVAELAENGNYAATTGQLFETNKDVTANKTAIDTINDSAAMKSGIDAAKVQQIATNATAISGLNNRLGTAEGNILKNTTAIAQNTTDIATNKAVADEAIKKNADDIAANTTAINGVASDIITGFTSTGGAVKAVRADNSTLDVAQLHNGVVNGGTITTGENNKKYLTLTVKDEYTGAKTELPGISLEGISSTIIIEGQIAPLTNGANIAFTPVYDTDGKTVKAISIGLQDEISLGSANFNTGNGYVWIDEDGISMTERGDEKGSNYGKFSEMTTDHITLGYQTTATDEKIYAALRPDSLTIDGHDYITKAGLNAGDKEIANVAVAELAENGNYAATTGQLFETNKIVEANKATIATAYTAASYSNNTLTLTRANGSTTTLTIAGGGGGEDQKAVHYNDDKTRINLEGNGGTTISNLKAGVNDTDAVNVKQMNTLLAGKQDTLSENQLAAVNSGITAEKVAKYEGYDARINDIGKTGTEAVSAKKVNETDEVASANAPGSIAQAYNASVSEASKAGIALGYGATVASNQELQSNMDNADEEVPGAEYATAVGSYSRATASLSTALGACSLADEANTVSVGNAQTGLYRRITNVDTPIYATDAVNKAYVDRGFASINNNMQKLDERTRQVGSHAAALSALHPLSYDPDAPTSFSAGVGTYRDEVSYAIGVFHYTSDRFMFNLAASVTEGADVMGRAGMSFSLGKGGKSIRTARKEQQQMQGTLADIVKGYSDMNSQHAVLASQRQADAKRIKQLEDELVAVNEELAVMREYIETKKKEEAEKKRKEEMKKKTGASTKRKNANSRKK